MASFRVMIRFSVWLVSCYAHVFVRLGVVMITDRTWWCHLLVWIVERKQFAVSLGEVDVGALGFDRALHAEQARQSVDEHAAHEARHRVRRGGSLRQVEHEHGSDHRNGDEDTREQQVLAD